MISANKILKNENDKCLVTRHFFILALKSYYQVHNVST